MKNSWHCGPKIVAAPGGRNQRHRIFSSPKRTLLLDHIFNHRATSTFGWYFFRATNSMLTATGFVTEAYLMLDLPNHWTSYDQWLPQGKWSWLAFARQFVRIIKNDVVHLAIDDTLTLGASSSVRGQCWVSLARDKAPLVRPRWSRLIPRASNRGQLIAAKTLFRD